MLGYVFIRLVSLLPILFGVSVLVFSLLHLVPGDIVDIMMGDQAHGDLNAAARLRQQLHLDRPVIEQYLLWLVGVLAETWARPSCRASRSSRTFSAAFP